MGVGREAFSNNELLSKEGGIFSILKKVGAILEDGHFVLTSGKHSSVYLDKNALFPYIDEVSQVSKMIADKYRDFGVEVVVGPALGGIILSQWVAFHLGQMTGEKVLGVFTEKNFEGEQEFTRGYDLLVRDRKTLVVEDITTTGASVRKVVESVEKTRGEVLGVCVMVNRNPRGVTSDTIGAPFTALGELELEAYDKESCPLCEMQVPIDFSVGHG